MRERIAQIKTMMTVAQWRMMLLALGPLVVIAIASVAYLAQSGIVSSNNAYLKASRVQISADVSGRVIAVAVAGNQPVIRGQVLFELDKAPFEIAVAHAEAGLLEAQSAVVALVARFHETESRLEQAKAESSYAEREYERQARLAQHKVASDAKLDAAEQAHIQARQHVAAIEQERAALLAELNGNASSDVATHPRVRAAQAVLDRARLDLAHTTVVAPTTGIVTQIENLRPGDYLEAGSARFAIVETSNMWVEANLKETEIRNVRPGQSATIRIDGYPGRVWHGRVQSVGAATGSEFAILPPQNATGNWIKVTQRVPVRVIIETRPDDPPLRLGLSASIKIDTKSDRRRPVVGALAGTPTP